MFNIECKASCPKDCVVVSPMSEVALLYVASHDDIIVSEDNTEAYIPVAFVNIVKSNIKEVIL